MTIFDQPDFIESAVLSYQTYSINFEEDVLSALLDCREFIIDAIDARAESNARKSGNEDSAEAKEG